jgi:hypothetical protein
MVQLYELLLPGNIQQQDQKHTMRRLAKHTQIMLTLLLASDGTPNSCFVHALLHAEDMCAR